MAYDFSVESLFGDVSFFFAGRGWGWVRIERELFLDSSLGRRLPRPPEFMLGWGSIFGD